MLAPCLGRRGLPRLQRRLSNFISHFLNPHGVLALF
jgi:hypothetical protein